MRFAFVDLLNENKNFLIVLNKLSKEKVLNLIFINRKRQEKKREEEK
jgi:hypothetical protein